MSEPKGTARFAAGKALVATAEKDADRVYPHFETIAALLGSDSQVVRWNVLQILARLAPADQAGKVEGVLDAYLAFIHGGDLISAANAIDGAARMTLAKPSLLDRTLPAMLSVKNATYATPECRNVAIAQTLDALAKLWPHVRSRSDVAAFIRGQQANTRAAAARRARQLALDLP